ncbi:MAG: hypothetical protein ABSB70_00985 [Candidatus Velthaea sp.]
MEAAVFVRIAVVVFGFALFVVAELVDNANARKPAATGARQAETLFDDAKVFTLRIFGAVAIAGGLLAFVFANHTPIF